MSILCVSGSASGLSSNALLLEALQASFPEKAFQQDLLLRKLPLYQPEMERSPLPEIASQWRAQCASARAVIISTPEYLRNIPAVLKNGLEWVKSSGELRGKPVLPITFTPHPPRGAHAMRSLCNSLQALEARIVVELPLYQNAIPKNKDGSWRLEGEAAEWLAAAMEMLQA